MNRAALFVVLTALPACAAPKPTAYSAPSQQDRDPPHALELSREAADLVANDPEKAEATLRDALSVDLFCGPAHNNLGVLYLKQGKLYEAANELEWARKLLPGTPEPRMNLAIVLESAGHTDEALKAYKTALEVAPEHIPTIQALARIEARGGVRNEDHIKRLEAISLRGETDEWRTWAREERARFRAPSK
jgi:tetratricopeptide (TPR) repeat protein